MLEVNSNWKTQHYDVAHLGEHTNFLSDEHRIQAHLRMVVETLKNRSEKGRGATMEPSRQKLLEALLAYADAGIFPMNIGHQERTPYFIDHRGVHCAVGYMMAKSGFGELAQKIHRENNFAYVKDLVNIYPELSDWADLIGFTVEELAWIQPGYRYEDNICESVCIENTFYPVLRYSHSEIAETRIFWFSSDSVLIKEGYGPFNRNPKVCSGESIYVKVVKDWGYGDTISDDSIDLVDGWGIYTYFNSYRIDLPEAQPLQYEVAISVDKGNCSGSVDVVTTDGLDLLYWGLNNIGRETSYSGYDRICHGRYQLNLMDERRCRYQDTIEVDSVYINNDAYWTVQPETGILKVTLDKNHFRDYKVSLHSSMGERFSPLNQDGNLYESSFQNLIPGIYVLTIHSNQVLVQRRIFVY